MKTIFTDGESIIASIRSTSSGGVHLIKMTLTSNLNEMAIYHTDCPALRMHGMCSHIQEAVRSFKSVRPWEFMVSVPEIKIIPKRITLEPSWTIIGSDSK